MKINFDGNSSAHLFITWAADLEVFNPNANEREHIGISHYITNQGWYVKEIEKDNCTYIQASREKEVKEWKVEPLLYTPYDQFVINLEKGIDQDASINMAYEDILLMHESIKNEGKLFPVKL
jgi:hypothetical protein